MSDYSWGYLSTEYAGSNGFTLLTTFGPALARDLICRPGESKVLDCFSIDPAKVPNCRLTERVVCTTRVGQLWPWPDCQKSKSFGIESPVGRWQND